MHLSCFDLWFLYQIRQFFNLSFCFHFLGQIYEKSLSLQVFRMISGEGKYLICLHTFNIRNKTWTQAVKLARYNNSY